MAFAFTAFRDNQQNLQHILFLIFVSLVFINCSDDDGNDIVPTPTPTPNVTAEARLGEALENIHKQSDFPGFTVGVIKNGEIAYQNSFGFQNIENNISYSSQTIQPIGSISKTFIGAATARAIELGHFTLETPINDILDNPIVNPNQPNDIIRVKHLVSHTSGLIDNDVTYLSSYYILPNEDLSTPGAQLMGQFGITQHSPLSLKEFIEAYYYPNGSYYDETNFSNFASGEVERYSNVASSLMAYLVEKATNISYKEFLRTEILLPLGMTNTSFEYQFPNANYATLYFDEDTPLPYYNLESFPDGALKTSNDDMMKYMADMLAGVRNESATFSEAFYDLLFSETFDGFTLFWGIEDRESNGFGHNGGDPGLVTELHFSGQFNIGFFVFSNYDASTDEHEAHYAATITNIFNELNTYLVAE